MTSTDVVDLCSRLDAVGVAVWIDGGWGVDALLGRQSRPHADLDIVIQAKDVQKVRHLLETQRYKEVPRPDTSTWNFVLSNGSGREVDVHVIIFDKEGNGLYAAEEKGVMYPAASLTGNGAIDGRAVKCISPEWMIKFHSGYEVKYKDFKDVSALCEKFDIDLPEEFRHFDKE